MLLQEIATFPLERNECIEIDGDKMQAILWVEFDDGSRSVMTFFDLLLDETMFGTADVLL